VTSVVVGLALLAACAGLVAAAVALLRPGPNAADPDAAVPVATARVTRDRPHGSSDGIASAIVDAIGDLAGDEDDAPAAHRDARPPAVGTSIDPTPERPPFAAMFGGDDDRSTTWSTPAEDSTGSWLDLDD
jgi:hypothetical protein